MTNQEQYDKIWKDSETLKALEEKLDTVTKQRDALIIALNYLNNTINAMDECYRYNKRYTGRFYRKHIGMLKDVMKNALLMAVDNSDSTIKLEEKEDDN